MPFFELSLFCFELTLKYDSVFSESLDIWFDGNRSREDTIGQSVVNHNVLGESPVRRL